MQILVCASVLTLAAAEFYDVIEPKLVPPEGGCTPWSQLPEYDPFWRDLDNKALAGAACVQHGRGNPVDADAHSLGAYCVANATGAQTACASAIGVPEQLNDAATVVRTMFQQMW